MPTPPITIVLLFLVGFLLICLKRENALQVYLAAVTLFPSGCAVIIGPASFYPMRFFAIFGLLRIIIRREKKSGTWNRVDFFAVLWSVTMLITGLLLPRPDYTFITRLGDTYDLFGTYFILRFLIQTYDDMFSVCKTIGVVFSVLAIFMIYEKVKGVNLFSYLGGVSPYPLIRDGSLRCQGPFIHAILAGTTGAIAAGWNFALFWQKNVKKFFVYLGTIASVLIVFLSSSSGPIMSFLFVLVGFSAWPFRNRMKGIQIGIFVSLLILHLTMKSPVWFLIAKIDLTGSSTGWHRSELIDSAIRHFNEWWLIGTAYTRHWMPTGVTWSPYQTDITNQYIKQGVNAGLLAMMAFIFMISNSFKMLGRKLKETSDEQFQHKIFLWALGASLFSHSLTFLTIRYFDQSFFYYLLLLTMIGCVNNLEFENVTEKIEALQNEYS